MPFVNTVDLIGDEVLASKIIGRSIDEIVDDITTKICNGALRNCAALEKADFAVATELTGFSFNGCSALKTLILRSKTMCTLDYASLFDDTHIKSGTGYIYVPAELIDSYKAATNWSTLASQIRAIEDYPDICGG